MGAPLFVSGADIAVNGGFTVDDDWIKEASWTIAGGKACIVADGDPLHHHMHQPYDMTRFVVYVTELDVTNVNFTGLNGLIVITNTAWSATKKITTNGHHVVTQQAGTGAVYPGIGFMVYRPLQVGEGCCIDNVQVFPAGSRNWVDLNFGLIPDTFYDEYPVDEDHRVLRYSNRTTASRIRMYIHN